MAKKKADTPRSFAHDSNARNSEKIIRLRLAHGAAGYGVYFMLLERLRDSPDYQAAIDYEVLAYDLREDPELIRSVIEDFGLFTLSADGHTFFSETLSSRLAALYAPKEPKKPKEEKEPIEAEIATETAPVPEPEAVPEPESDLQNLIDRTCSDGRWLAEIADKYDCTTKYVIKKLRNEIRDYCLANPPAPTNLPDLRTLADAWLSGTI